MNIGQQILLIVSVLGAFNGFVLSLYLFFSKKSKAIAGLFLGILLLVVSIRVAKSVFVYFNPRLPKIYLQIGLSACFLIGPSLYFFFRSALMKITVMPVSWKWHWAILLGVLLLAGILFPYQNFPAVWNNYFAQAIYLQWFIYLAAAGFLLGPVLKKLFEKTAVLTTTEKFWLFVFLGSCIIFLVYLLAFARIIYGIYIYGPLSFSFILYLTVFFYLYSARIEHILKADEVEQLYRSEKKKIEESDASAWIGKLAAAVLSKELYKDPNLKLNDLAQKINIPPYLLSQLLNDNLGKSFSTFVNEYRINEACRLIAANDRLTFEAIGYEVGYNSKSTFYTAFKKIKDTTPALYKETLAMDSTSRNGTDL